MKPRLSYQKHNTWACCFPLHFTKDTISPMKQKGMQAVYVYYRDHIMREILRAYEDNSLYIWLMIEEQVYIQSKAKEWVIWVSQETGHSQSIEKLISLLWSVKLHPLLNDHAVISPPFRLIDAPFNNNVIQVGSRAAVKTYYTD